MENYLKLFVLLFFFNSLSGQRIDVKFLFEGRLRESIIVIPSKAPPVGGYPVVMVLHSSAHDAEEPYNIFGWKELGEKENFITIFPSSLRWCVVDGGVEKNIARWVNGGVIESPCAGPPQNYVDDVKFLKYLIKSVKDTFPVNSSKVYVSGFSNGSAMVHKLAMEAGDVFIAAAGSGGMMFASDSTLNPVKRIPIWFMLGSSDDMFIVPPFTELPFYGDSILGYLKVLLNRSISCQGLSSVYEHNETPITQTYIWNESQSGGPSTSPYIFTLVKNLKHQYPNGINYPLEAAKLFWEFFKQSSVVQTQDVSNQIQFIKAFPNPSSEEINIQIDHPDWTPPYDINIFNSYGQLVYSERAKNETNFILDKKLLGSGLFIVKIQNGKGQNNLKLVFN